MTTVLIVVLYAGVALTVIVGMYSHYEDKDASGAFATLVLGSIWPVLVVMIVLVQLLKLFGVKVIKSDPDE